MKVVYITCIGLLLLAVLATGCTSQPAQTPVTPAATAVPTADRDHPGNTSGNPYQHYLETRMV